MAMSEKVRVYFRRDLFTKRVVENANTGTIKVAENHNA
jgi:hypothetical protein